MPSTLSEQISEALGTVDPRGSRGRRLLDNSARLCASVDHLLTLNLVPTPVDAEALKLACSALQLTLKHEGPGERRLPMTLRDRAESAAELLISSVEGGADAALLDRTASLLRQMPQRSPALPEARLLADAANLEDFGVTGLLNMMSSVTLAGDGLSQLVEACNTREQYGYWDARLARFHFPVVRALAERRLAGARQVYALLRSELPGTGTAP
jgi:hypothetical protein